MKSENTILFKIVNYRSGIKVEEEFKGANGVLILKESNRNMPEGSKCLASFNYDKDLLNYIIDFLYKDGHSKSGARTIYLAEAILYAINKPISIRNCYKEIMINIAEKYGKTPNNIDFSIRKCIFDSKLVDNWENYKEYFNKRPTAKTYISVVSVMLRNKIVNKII